jgi:hypothetical protein
MTGKGSCQSGAPTIILNRSSRFGKQNDSIYYSLLARLWKLGLRRVAGTPVRKHPLLGVLIHNFSITPSAWRLKGNENGATQPHFRWERSLVNVRRVSPEHIPRCHDPRRLGLVIKCRDLLPGLRLRSKLISKLVNLNCTTSPIKERDSPRSRTKYAKSSPIKDFSPKPSPLRD